MNTTRELPKSVYVSGLYNFIGRLFCIRLPDDDLSNVPLSNFHSLMSTLDSNVCVYLLTNKPFARKVFEPFREFFFDSMYALSTETQEVVFVCIFYWQLLLMITGQGRI